ncbi:MAG: YchJ family metal-binding protein [Syntrophotaleaceae bacterium]
MKTGRNDPCPCGSGKKFKKCCLGDEDAGSCPAGVFPAALVEARRRAFAEQDFGFIYDSYHPDSPFRRHFPNRRGYLIYARRELRGAFEILQCRVLGEEFPSEGEARVLFYLDVLHGAERLETIELSRFLQVGGVWLYHSGHKVPRSAFDKPLEEIEPGEVERLAEGISF